MKPSATTVPRAPSCQTEDDVKARLSFAPIIGVLCSIAAISARADTLVLDSPHALWKSVGANLQIGDGLVSIVVYDYVTYGVPDRIMRSSLDTQYWYWDIYYQSALAEGWGDCVVRAGAPDAILVCDD
jgi:hypothetical protein